MTLSTVTLMWDLTDLIEAGLSATLSITPTAQLSDSTDHLLIPPVARQVNFVGGTGQLAGIVANDNANILPAGTGYLISVTSASGQVIVPQFQTQILFSNGATQWLDALAVVPVVTTSYQYLPLPSGTATAGYVPIATGSGEASAWGPNGSGGGGSGTVTTVSVATANGFAGTVATPTTTPAITVKTTATGILKGNGTAVSAAIAGTDYLAPTGNGSQLTGITESQVTNLVTDLAAKAPLASPALTGTPTAPTAAALTDSTQVATTAYADSAVAVETSRAEAAEAAVQANAEAYSSPTTTLGDTIYGGASGVPTRLAGNTTATRKFWRQTGTGTVSAAPAWDTLQSGDIPANAANTSGTAANLSGTPALPNGTTATTQTAADNSTKLATTAYADSSATTAAAGKVNRSGDTMTGYLAPDVAALTFVGSGTTLVNAALGNSFNLTLTASTTTLGNPSNPVDGQVIRFRITQGSGGSFTLAYGTAYDFGTAGSPTLSTAAAKVDILGFEYVSSISKWCYLGSGLGF